MNKECFEPCFDHNKCYLFNANFHYCPGPDIIKLFKPMNYKFSKKARAFVPVKPFQPSLMFVGKARSLHLKVPALIANFDLSQKGLRRKNTPAYYGHKMLHNIGLCCQSYKTFYDHNL